MDNEIEDTPNYFIDDEDLAKLMCLVGTKCQYCDGELRINNFWGDDYYGDEQLWVGLLCAEEGHIAPIFFEHGSDKKMRE
ncbi:hypothetical protein LCGC14_1297210 [marine sediment metagenome]|uniref:Uncharacterized protein n=1 Tax=marine sediment metagenome TaxID=412755 RepID=A0A0F9N793_9ZZZZ